MTIELAALFDLKEGLNEKMVNIILQAIRDKHESGLDYLRFKQSVKISWPCKWMRPLQ
ncbi:MAG: hypothetical protein IPP37_02615 [Saprospiraceae bacterium]|nr:hypothetical protein [Saprospiraceae bacterium]